ncbi:hypothetical protein [Riemerella anatipestifer]|uniref:hypothetical protein n=1 Tax=Riemerella anatipestifer TaxID=34085 RepID=UPI001BD94DCE|nr:hypothetical protein [Riemerella anatipestifer]MBT0552069.1 hypothetical protein [Riemerella anatipestifer]MBT0554344.1 hypothetical protein [Riemerella anatipestifer]MCE3024867.1 hypothetical protein [Riemerella anatipestifer]MCU7543041.1 hypothetical protein [Riemerella anatipestifer]MCU7560600.1 hypothetical protein [Riemerella anatipestifer]
MKNFFKNLGALIVLAVFVFTSCRKEDNIKIPKDVHDHDEIEYLSVSLTDLMDNSIQKATFRAGGADKEIILKKDHEYQVNLSLESDHGDHRDDVTKEILAEKDEHFFVFRFAEVVVKVTRQDDATSTRKDGKKLGLKTKWTVISAPEPNAKVNIRLYHKPVEVNEHYYHHVKDSQYNDEAGSVKGGEEDIDATFDIK